MRRKRRLLVIALAVAFLAAVCCIRFPRDDINPEAYQRLVEGMSERDVDAILAPRALPTAVLRVGGGREVAEELAGFCVGREIRLKQLPNYDAEIYDKNTGELLGKSRSWEGYR